MAVARYGGCPPARLQPSNRPEAANRAEETLGGCVVAVLGMVPRKTDVAMVRHARGLAWSWVTSSTLVNRCGSSYRPWRLSPWAPRPSPSRPSTSRPRRYRQLAWLASATLCCSWRRCRPACSPHRRCAKPGLRRHPRWHVWMPAWPILTRTICTRPWTGCLRVKTPSRPSWRLATSALAAWCCTTCRRATSRAPPARWLDVATAVTTSLARCRSITGCSPTHAAAGWPSRCSRATRPDLHSDRFRPFSATASPTRPARQGPG